MGTKTASDLSVQTLGAMASDCAIKAAFAYLERHGQMTLENCDKLSDSLRRLCRAALPIALQDAKEALDCGMRETAIATFKATMMQAGIAAAKEVYFVQE